MRRSLVVYALILSISFGAAYADYGIVLDNTCLAFLKNNLTTNCPGYEIINLIFPDTSNRKISGDFVIKQGIFQRQEPQYEHHYNNYRYDENKDRIWIDPPGDVIDKLKLITITPHDFIYKIGGQTITNSSILIGQGRYITPNCSDAIITANNYLFLLGDTMKTIKENCAPGSSNFNEIKIKTWEKTVHDITTSYKYQLDKWIKESLIKCKGKCFEY